jgi:type VI secretion system protein ImpF
MGTSAPVRDRLQPALLDRLIDADRPQSSEGEDQRYLSRTALREAVLRDLGWLFNAVQTVTPQEGVVFQQVARSVLNYGLPAMSGQVASRVDVSVLEGAIRDAVITFEPRILADSLSVRAIESEDILQAHNVIEFEIRGWMWAQPVPLELLLRTQLDLEVGQVKLRDLAPGAAGRLRGAAEA